MRLTRLELSGFKSFAGTVELPFEAGVTAIVGPNGCGKSNISDAVRWVLGEQSPRLLRGGKMEDVIFQGSTGRRPVNVAEVSLVFDNADGTLPIAYQDVLITRRLSRSGQSEYLLNRQSVRLRDIQDLLRGTGLGADAAVVMEAKMIDALLSEKAEERRALFEEAAGIGLYRNRKQSYERRLEETAADLARLEDLVAEVQTQARSLARQRGRAERFTKMIDERYGVAVTLLRRELEDFDLALGALGVRTRELGETLPGARTRFADAEREREARVQARHTAEVRRTEIERRLADGRIEAGRLEGDLALAAERLANSAQQRTKAGEERGENERRAAEAAAAVGRARRRVAELREREAHARAGLRQAEEVVAQLAARRDALAELDRERVGLAPAAQALLKVKTRFGDAVIGPLSDFVRTGRRDAELAERLLGEWLHAVLVRDESAVGEIRRWHEEVHPGPLVLLPCLPGPRLAADGEPLPAALRVDGPAAAWVRALLTGHEVLEGGRALRRANGAVFLDGATSGGPLQRRAELEAIGQDLAGAEGARERAGTELRGTTAELAQAEEAFAAAGEAAEQARHRELESAARKGDAERAAAHARREATDAASQVDRLSKRLAAVEQRLTSLGAELRAQEVERVRFDERLGAERARLAELEGHQEAAREQRVHWQVEAAQVEARLGAARERTQRAAADAEAAVGHAVALGAEIAQIDRDTGTLTSQRAQWQDGLQERRVTLQELAAAAQDAEAQVTAAEAAVADAEAAVEAARAALDTLGDEQHRLQLERSQIEGRKRAATERVEAEWRKPMERLLADAPEVAGDVEWLREENERLRTAIEAVGPVNALAVEEHADEVKRLEFLMTQRDDLVAARNSLQQAAREIDQTAKQLFLDSFGKVRENFRAVFQTLFGGGECDVRLANEDEPLTSEIEIHAAPRGKRTQRIHLLSSGERTLVAVSLLFAIFLARPSPFCLLDEVDAPLDDANVGRYVRLLSEFKDQTQFIVITHNPRTMQAADAVYGVTMQEPGVSTIVGVRLGQMEPV